MIGINLDQRYAFYDFETTGTSPKFDQALQFAAILTDENFSPLEEVNIRCRLSDHILPSPIAMAITGVTPDDLHSPNLSAYEFSIKLAELVERWTPAIWTGYNTIAFDENVFRQLFYQNLQPNLYLTQMNRNQRLDILKAVLACWALNRHELEIPTRLDGKPTARLDMLAPLNGFEDHHAHDALGDVKATIHVAKIIREQIPEVWSLIHDNLNKNMLRNELMSGTVFGLIERFGGAPPKIYTGVYCGTNRDNPNQVGFFDLSLADAEDYLSGDDKLYAEAVEKSPKIIRSVDLNKLPLLFPITNPSAEQLNAGQLFKNSSSALAATSKALAERFADRDAPELVEAQIYEGFYTNEDKSRLRQFHALDWPDRWDVVSSFSDERLQELGRRLMVLYAPQFTPQNIKNDFRNLVAGRWSGDIFYGENERDPGNTYESVEADLMSLQKGEPIDIDSEFLEQLVSYFSYKKPTF